MRYLNVVWNKEKEQLKKKICDIKKPETLFPKKRTVRFIHFYRNE